VSNSTASFTGLVNPATAAGQSYSLVLYNGPCCYTVVSTTLAQQTCICTLTLKPTVSGCYSVTGASKATVSVEVSWENITVSSTANDASDEITVTFAGQTKTIDPGSYTSIGGNGAIVSPQVVAFEVPADATTQTAQVFIGTSYAVATCKAQKTGRDFTSRLPTYRLYNGASGRYGLE